METVGTAVEGLDDLDLLVPILRELATRHIDYKVTKQHFSVSYTCVRATILTLMDRKPLIYQFESYKNSITNLSDNQVNGKFNALLYCQYKLSSCL